MNFESNCIEEYGSLVRALDRGDVRFKQKNLELDMKNRESLLAKQYIEEAQNFELQALQPNLWYVFSGKGTTFHVIIASYLNVEQVECLVEVLKRFKPAIAWIIANIIGVPCGIFSH